VSYAVQAAVLAVPLLAFASVAIDLGWLGSVDAELQNAADSAALAAASHLASNDPVAGARTFAAFHTAGGGPVTLADSDVEIGSWDGKTWTSDRKQGKYVRVTVHAEPEVLLAEVFGVSTFPTARSAIATMRGAALCGIVSLSSSIELNGNATVNSYDSKASLAPTSYGANGAICSNATRVALQGNLKVVGSVLAGPGGEVTVGGSASVSGTTGALSMPLTAANEARPGTYAALPASIKKATALAPGNYYLKGDFQVTGRGYVSISGKTDLYVDGNVSIDGKGFVNGSKDPRLLTIHVIGNHDTHNNGNSVFYGSILAPESEVELNGTMDSYGYVVGRYVHLNGNAAFHIDTSLITSSRVGGAAVLAN
jgi:Flp pilus assembly protein TadG